MGATAGLKLRQVAENLENILSLELLCAAQGVDLRRKAVGGKARLGVGSRKIYSELRKVVPFIERDEYMKRHVDSALRIVRIWDSG